MKAPVILCLVGGAVLVGAPYLRQSSPEIPAEKPQERLVKLVQPIVDEDFTANDADAVAAFCAEFADVLERDADTKAITDTSDLHDRLQQSSKLMFQATGIGDRHPDIPEQINDVLASWLEIETEDGGVEVAELDGDKDLRGWAAEAFRAIAWAAGQ